jgi:hypothetical protein
MATTKNSNGNTVINNSVELMPEEGQSIEAVTAINFKREVFEEAFMNEFVTILVAETADDNVNPMPTPSVNGVMQLIPRGMPVRVKRKYVEVLARCKETKYSQKTLNPMEPERIEMIPRTALTYPFHVVEDKNPIGAAWLAAVLIEHA